MLGTDPATNLGVGEGVMQSVVGEDAGVTVDPVQSHLDACDVPRAIELAPKRLHQGKEEVAAQILAEVHWWVDFSVVPWELCSAAGAEAGCCNHSNQEELESWSHHLLERCS